MFAVCVLCENKINKLESYNNSRCVCILFLSCRLSIYARSITIYKLIDNDAYRHRRLSCRTTLSSSSRNVIASRQKKKSLSLSLFRCLNKKISCFRKRELLSLVYGCGVTCTRIGKLDDSANNLCTHHIVYIYILHT